MKRFSPIFTAVAAIPLLMSAAPSFAQSGGEQGEVRRERKAGNVKPLREIEGAVLSRMGNMQYLGPEYDSAAMSYRLKFIQNGKVVFVDVDARTGRVIGQTR